MLFLCKVVSHGGSSFQNEIFMSITRWMVSQWRLSGFLCSLSRSWWWWWSTCPWPAQSVSFLIQTHLNRKLVSVWWVNGADCDSVPPSDSGSFDGSWLLWDVPWAVSPLVGEGAVFESQSLSLGVEGVLLDEPTTTARGFSLVQKGHLVQIGVPLGAEGGYRKVQSVPSKLQKGTRFWWTANMSKTRTDDIVTDSRFSF